MRGIIPGNGSISRDGQWWVRRWFYSGRDLFFPAVGINQAYPCSITNQVQGTLKIKLAHDIGAGVIMDIVQAFLNQAVQVISALKSKVKGLILLKAVSIRWQAAPGWASLGFKITCIGNFMMSADTLFRGKHGSL